MQFYERFVQNIRIRRFAVLIILIGILWLCRSVMSTLLLTFIFTFLMVHLINWIRKRRPKARPWMVVIPIYILVALGIYWVIAHYAPILIKQFVKLFQSLYKFYERPEVESNAFLNYISQYIASLNLNEQIRASLSKVLEYVTNVGGAGVTFIISLILSFFYSIEVDQLKRFGQLFLESDFGWFFQDLYFFGQKFVNSFGVVIEAQLLIAVVNTTLTTITLAIMQMPSLATLAMMVFFLSLIPVAGVIVSLIPLSFIGYTVGGFRYIIYILIMIIIIHIIEAYILNPKFMSSRTQLPVFFTFVVLIASERLFGTWGLIIGIPVFSFFLDILGVKQIPGTKRMSQRLNFHLHKDTKRKDSPDGRD